MTKTTNPNRMNTEEAADYLGVSAKYLTNLRSKREGPDYYKMGGVFYRLEDLEAYLQSKKVTRELKG